ncbi:MAG: response regulator [Ilumatobacter sp.]
MTNRILFVDDEPLVLSGIRRVLRRHYTFDMAESGAAGLELLRQHEYAAVVSDMRMPHMSGEEFLAQTHQVQPAAVQVILSGQASLEATIEAVNRGQIFRFLMKPASPEAMRLTIDQALRQYDLIHSERHLLEQTLAGAIGALTDVLEMIVPSISQRTTLVVAAVERMTSHVDIAPAWPLKLAAMLSGVGYASVPSDILERAARGKELNDEERIMIARHTEVVSQLLGRIPRLEGVTSIIRAQAGAERTPPLLARHVAALDIAVKIAHGMLRGASCDDVVAELLWKGSSDNELLATFESRPIDDPTATQEAGLDDLHVGMTLRSDVETKGGVVLARPGTVISAAMLIRFRNFGLSAGIREPFLVSEPPPEPEPLFADLVS